jgi:hypothetical protein
VAQPRLLSHSEIDTALTCWARHAFAYTGRLTEGYALRPREIPVVLSEGRAHGSAVARWHERGRTLTAALEAAEALRRSLAADEQEMMAAGVTPPVENRVATESRLTEILGHYVDTVEPLGNLTRLEEEIVVAIPSRTGVHASSRYRFQCFIDGWTLDEQGRPWLVEFKLRRRLQTVELIANSRQLRWYAWALRQAKGIEPVGVLVDETWNETVSPPRMIASGVSHARQQHTTADRYIAVCREHGVEPHVDTSTHIERFCRALCELPVTAVFVCHEYPVKDEGSGQLERLPWTGTTNPALGSKLMGMVDIVGYTGVVEHENGEREYIAQLVTQQGRRGGDRFGGVLGDWAPVNIERWMSIIGATKEELAAA